MSVRCLSLVFSPCSIASRASSLSRLYPISHLPVQSCVHALRLHRRCSKYFHPAADSPRFTFLCTQPRTSGQRSRCKAS